MNATKAVIAAGVMCLIGCVSAETSGSALKAPTKKGHEAVAAAAAFEQDRVAILAMAGDYQVTFDFTETVPFAPGYALKDKKLSGAFESVRVTEDRGDFISLQHILVVGGNEGVPIKHWRQDWRYEPETVLTFVGGNAWETKAVPPSERAGRWSQVVYQVDDSPRYGAVGAGTHDDGVSQWTPPRAMRPLPRRDATTRDDYHAVDAVNRHAITPAGWVHEQNNDKLVLAPRRQVLVREIGVNTYTRFDDYDVRAAEDYWAQTKAYWAGVRKKWTAIEKASASFGLTIQGEPEALYTPLMELATEVTKGEASQADAIAEAERIIDRYTTSDVGTLAQRLAANTTLYE